MLILGIGVHLHFFVSAPPVITDGNDGLFSVLLGKYVVSQPQTFLFVIYHTVLLIQAIRLNMVLNELRMYQQHSYTVAMAYVLLSAILLQWCSISAAFLSNFMLIWIFIKLSRLYNHPSPKTLLFNTGLVVGVSIICYHPTAILVVVVLFALAVVRPFRLAEWLILLMGALLPFYFVFSWLFLQDNTAAFSSFLPSLHLGLPLQRWDVPFIVSVSFLLLALLTGLVYWQRNINRMVIQIRKNWGVMMVILLVLLPIPFIFYHAGIESAIMSLVPLAAFAANGFSYPRRLFLPNLLFWLAIVLIIHHNLALIKN
ncbi:MAG: hypothetical protein NVS3B15_13560 [Sediminibacterium sp.]